MDEVDRDARDQPFVMPIMDVFNVKGRGIAVAGQVQQGIARRGDEVEIGHIGKPLIKTTITGFVIFGAVDWVQKGDNIGITLSEVKAGEIESGMIMASPGFLSS